MGTELQDAMVSTRPIGWIRGPAFDYPLVFGSVALGLIAAAVVGVSPALFPWVLFFDFWLLGYHHVIATFTRMAFDRESLEEYRFFVFALPLIVLVATFGIALSTGAWAITTIYFYWQWFHYTRQSYGVEQIYWRNSGQGGEKDGLTWYVIYLVPLWGMLSRSAQGSETAMTFLGGKMAWLPVPHMLANVAGVVAVGAVVAWAINRAREAARGELRLAHTLYVVTHTAMFTIGYIFVPVVEYGWLAVNIWHNIQYMFIVWLFNTNRFKAGIDPAAPFLSKLSQPRNALWYVTVTFTVTAVVYLGIKYAMIQFAMPGIAGYILVYQTINFHHYIVDSFVWKLRKKAVSSQLATA